MNRRGILAAGGAAAAVTGLAAPALAQGRVEWRMVTLWPRNLPGPGVAAQKVADRIGAVTAGRISVRLFAAGEVSAGNVLGKGYLAGIGVTIGTAFGRIAGTSAARAALAPASPDKTKTAEGALSAAA